jgi:UDP-N-acetylmuramoyl-tripeptide--D-alanyl-D-alanine ligase
VRYNGNGAIRARDVKPALLLEFNAVIEDETVEVKTGLIGTYNVENVLAACAAGILFGISRHDILDAIADYRPAGHRSQLIDTGRNHVIMDSYNANPSSLTAALNEFIDLDKNEKMAILGEMAEVGTSVNYEHEAVLAMLKEGDPGIEVICVGGAFRNPAIKAGIKHISNTDKLTGYLRANPVSGRFILVKGSRVNRMEKLLDYL